MSRIDNCFQQLKKDNKKALIPYIAAGDPEPKMTVHLLHAMVEAGADIIELGVPFSDPMADGPIIQKAYERALIHKTSLKDILNMVSEFREKNTNTPIVLMGYLNPVEALGYERFADLALKAGVDGVLLVDLTSQEAAETVKLFNDQQLDTIFLLSPTTSVKRIKSISKIANGFLYYVSLKGVTGSNKLDTNEVKLKIDTIREHTSMPVGVGFGIKTPEDASAVASFSDAVIIGSSLVSCIENSLSDYESIEKNICNTIKEMRIAIDNVSSKQRVA